MRMWMRTDRTTKCSAFANAAAYTYGYGGQAEVRRLRRDEPEGRPQPQPSTPGWSRKRAELGPPEALGDA